MTIIVYRKSLLILAGIFILVTVALAVYALVHNGKLISNFDDSTNTYDYETAVKNGRVEQRDLRRILTSVSAAIKLNVNNDLAAPDSISYYQYLGDKTPYYVINKGDEISARIGDAEITGKAYGLNSLPTTERGWRLAKPFEVKNAAAVDKLLYVKLSDLRKVCGDWFKQNPHMISPAKSAAMRRMLLSQDYLLYHGLYSSGDFLSPDLLMPVFSFSSFVLLLLAVSSLCIRALLVRKT